MPIPTPPICKLLLTALLMLPVLCVAQIRVPGFINRILNDTSSAASSRVVVLPALGFSPETSLELGLRVFSLYHARQDTTVNRLSELVLYSFVTLRAQFGLQFENAIYTDRNRYFLLGRVRFQQFPLLFFGIGPAAGSERLALVNATSLQIRQRLLRQVRGNFYAGPQIDFQTISNVQLDAEQGQMLPPLVGAGGARTSGLGLTLVYDSRANVLNVRRGEFLEVGGLTYRSALGSEFAYQNFSLDGRIFRPLGRSNRVLAGQIFGQVMGGNVPFYNLALLGGDQLMRGYYLGRYRDKVLLAGQVELRWLPFSFSKRWGGNTFAALGTVAPSVSNLQIRQVQWAAGAGVQFLLFPRKDVFLRADLGVTREGTGLYFSLGEAF